MRLARGLGVEIGSFSYKFCTLEVSKLIIKTGFPTAEIKTQRG